jgi:NADH-quinone oxidoreductase subunit A
VLQYYLPILVLFVLAFGFAAFSVGAATFTGPKRYNRAKYDAWAVAFGRLGVFGLVEMVLFILTVFVAYAYVWRRGGLEWD